MLGLEYNATTKEDRLKYLKSIKKLANKFLEENKIAGNKGLHNWQSDVVSNNIIQLKMYIQEINKELHPDAISKFLSEEKAYRESSKNVDFQLPLPFLSSQWRISSMWVEIAKFSYRYSIINDMYWIKDGTIKDHFEVAMGIKTEDFFEQYCDEYIEFISISIIPFFKGQTQYSEVVLLLEDLVRNFDSSSFLSSNIIMYSIIESIVRTFCTDVIHLQHPELTPEEAKNKIQNFMSLENLINKGEWKNIRPIEFAEAVIFNNYIADEELKNAAKIHKEQNEFQMQVHTYSKELLNFLENSANIDPDIVKEKSLQILDEIRLVTKKMVDRKSLYIYVSLKVDLQFLVRRYKENRNSMVHGDFKNFNYKWYCYVNLSSIKKLYNVIIAYQKLRN